MEPSPNAKPVSQDVEYALALFWGIGRVYDLFGTYIADRRFKKAKFPTRDTKPTEKECRAALARILSGDEIPAALLRELAAAVHPEGGYVHGISRRVCFKKLDQGHRDDHRDFTVAGEIRTAMCRGVSYDEAGLEIAKLAGISVERAKDIYRQQKPLLDALDKAASGIKAAADADLPAAFDKAVSDLRKVPEK